MSFDDGMKREESLKAALNVDAAVRLADVMREISEEHYCAGWLSDLEFRLWDVIEGNPKAFAAGNMSDKEISDLKELRERSGGWWYFDPDEGELFESIEAFKLRHAAEKKPVFIPDGP